MAIVITTRLTPKIISMRTTDSEMPVLVGTGEVVDGTAGLVELEGVVIVVIGAVEIGPGEEVGVGGSFGVGVISKATICTGAKKNDITEKNMREKSTGRKANLALAMRLF